MIANGGQIPRSEEQTKRIRELLRESDSVHSFVETQVVAKPMGKVTSEQLYSAYLRFCSAEDWQPVPHQKAKLQIKQEIESRFHISQSHNLGYDGSQRGYFGI